MIARVTISTANRLRLLAMYPPIRIALIAASLAVSAAGMLALLRSGAADISWNLLRVQPAYLLAAFMAIALSSLGGGRYWQYLLSAAGAELSTRDALRIWCLSNLAKYGFGAISQYAGRLYLAERRGVHWRGGAASVALELGLIVGSGVIMLLFLAPLAQQSILPPPLFPFVPLGPFVGLAGLAAMIFASDLLLRMIPNLIHRGTGVRAKVGLALAIVVINWSLLGIAAFLIIRSLEPTPVAAAPSVIFAVIAAFVGGLLALTPLGIGVRDVTLALILAQLVSPSVAALAAVLHRIMTVLVELILAAFFLIPWRAYGRSNKRSH